MQKVKFKCPRCKSDVLVQTIDQPEYWQMTNVRNAPREAASDSFSRGMVHSEGMAHHREFGCGDCREFIADTEDACIQFLKDNNMLGDKY
jgi:hypothetical protein